MDAVYEDIEEDYPNKEPKYLPNLMIWLLICLPIQTFRNSHKIIYYRYKTKRFSRFYYTIFRIDSAHHFNLKIPNKLELQQTAFNYSSDIDIKDFMNLYK